MNRLKGAFLGLILLMSATPALAQPRQWAPVAPGTAFESGDSWVTGGKRFRLYGVKACERGRKFTNAAGVAHDCGEASLAMLVSLIRDLNPVCSEVARDDRAGISHVICIAIPERGAARGSRIDLGTALVASGFGFAARDEGSKPIHRDYAVAEEIAKRGRIGLWKFVPFMPRQ